MACERRRRKKEGEEREMYIVFWLDLNPTKFEN
jgi:hypothetical protein